MAKYIPKVIPEPIWEKSAGPCSQFDLVKAFQWYNDNKESRDARKYLIEYLTKNQLINATQKQASDSLNNSWNIVDGWLARCLSRGAWVPDNTYANFNKRIEEFKARLDTIIAEKGLGVAQPQTTEVVSIQERVQVKVDQYIAELEGKFDDLWHRASKEDFVPYTWMVENGVKPMHATKIAEYFRERARDWVKMIDARKTDEYVKESYPRSHKEYLHGANILTMFMSDAEKLAANKNAARKPRKKKAIPLEKKVAKLKYKAEDIENKLVSISPVKIMGAEKLWVYNVKTRRLGVYIASDAAGLSVKGSAIDNYKYSESISKTLRKPEAVLKKVLEGGKIVLRKVMGEINSKPVELNGRVNQDTILLRVE
jgi:hypothetical protein